MTTVLSVTTPPIVCAEEKGLCRHRDNNKRGKNGPCILSDTTQREPAPGRTMQREGRRNKVGKRAGVKERGERTKCNGVGRRGEVVVAMEGGGVEGGGC